MPRAQKIPPALREKLVGHDAVLREQALTDLVADPALLAILFENPESIHAKADKYSYAWSHREDVRKRLLSRLGQTLPELPECALSWAEKVEHLTWTAADGPLDTERLRHFANLKRLELNGFDLEVKRLESPTLEQLSIVGGTIGEDLAPLADGMPQLVRLSMSKVKMTALRGLTRLSRLSQLIVEHTPLRSIPDLPALEKLSIDECAFDSLEDIALPPQLRELTLRALSISDLAPLARLNALTSLSLEQCPELRSLAPFEAGPSTTLRLRDVGLRDPRGLAPDAKGHLWLSDLPALSSLAGLDPSVRTLRLRNCGALESVRGLPAGLEELDIDNCLRLLRWDGIEACTHLKRIRLYGVGFTDLGPLASLPALEAVQAKFNESIETLGALPASPSVRAITLDHTKVARKDVPAAHRWKCSWAWNASIEELLAQRPPDPRDALPKDKKKQLSAIRKLLKATSAAELDQAIELAASLDDPDLFDQLLARVSWSRPKRHRTRDYGDVATLEGGGFSGSLGLYALIGLIADAPAASKRAQELREQITELGILAQRTARGKAPVRPAHVARLPKLARLTLSRVGPIRVDETPPWPSLTHLTLHELGTLDHLDWLKGASQLDSLNLHQTSASLSALPSVRKLSLFCANVQLGTASGWALRELYVGYASRVTPLDAVGELVGLESLHGGSELVPIAARLPKLRKLGVRGPSGDLRALARHPSLRVLEVEDTPVDLSFLDTIPNLETVTGRVPPHVHEKYPYRPGNER